MRAGLRRIWPLALVLAGCGGAPAVRSHVELPPELPVRVFPEIAIVAEGGVEEAAIADALAAQLARRTGARIDRVDWRAVVSRREEGRVSPAAAVLAVRAVLREITRAAMVPREQPVCGPWGCTTERRMVLEEIPMVIGILELRVSAARSGDILQALRIEESDEGADPMAMRMRVLSRLRERALAAIEPARREVEVELVEIDDPAVRLAIMLARRGQPQRARAELEALVRDDTFSVRPASERAAIFFNLGQTRRLAAHLRRTVDPDAEASIRHAISIDPRSPYARALAQIEVESRAEAGMRAHREAAVHNYALAREPAIPPPPPAYIE